MIFGQIFAVTYLGMLSQFTEKKAKKVYAIIPVARYIVLREYLVI